MSKADANWDWWRKELLEDLIPILPGDKRPALSGWQDVRTDQARVDMWVTSGWQVGLHHRRVIGVDIDIENPDAVDNALALLGVLRGDKARGFFYLRRRPGTGKCLLLVRPSWDLPLVPHGVGKWALTGKKGDQKYGVEIRGEGHQSVLDGVHPSGDEYVWPHGRPLVHEIPVIAPGVLWEWLEKMAELLERGGWTVKLTGGGHVSPAPGTGTVGASSKPAADLEAPASVGLDELHAVVWGIENRDLEYDDWVRVGLALAGAVGGSGSQRALDLDAGGLWDMWSAVSTKYDSGVTGARWDSFGAVTDIGWGTLLHLAGADGWEPSGDWLKVVRGDPALEFDVVVGDGEDIFGDVVVDGVDADAGLRAEDTLAGLKSPGLADAEERDDEAGGVALRGAMTGWYYTPLDDRFFRLRAPEEMLKRAAFNALFRDRAEDMRKAMGVKRAVTPAEYFETRLVPRGRMVRRVTYAPGAGMWGEDRTLNVWVPGPGHDAGLEGAGLEEPTPWLELVGRVWDELWVMDAVLDWMAHALVEPGSKPGWHVMVCGGQGIGKNMALLPLEWGMGPWNVMHVNPGHVTGQFNTWASHGLIVADELRQTTRGQATGHDAYNLLKMYLDNTAAELAVQPKGLEVRRVRNVSRWVLTSNEDVPVPVALDDRRLLVHVSDGRRASGDWYGKVLHWLTRGGSMEGCRAVCGWLRRRAFERGMVMGHAPMTVAKRDMAVEGTWGEEGAWVAARIAEGEFGDLTTLSRIHDRLKLERRGQGVHGRRLNRDRDLPALLRALGAAPLLDGKQVRVGGGGRVKVWAVRRVEAWSGAEQDKVVEGWNAQEAGVAAAPFEVIDGGRD